MTGGLGFVSDGNKRQRSNRALSDNITSTHFKKSSTSHSEKVYTFKKSSPETLKQIREKMNLERKAKTKRSIILFAVLLALATLFFLTI